MKMMKFTGMAAVLLAASACSTQSTSFANETSAASMTQGVELAAMQDTLGAAGTTTVANMPSTGFASYDGVARYDLNQTMYSDVLMDVDFESGQVSGQLANFTGTNQQDDLYEGSIGLSGSVTGNNLNAAGVGNPLNDKTFPVWAVVMDGKFAGNNAAGALGDLSVNIGNDPKEIEYTGQFAVSR